MSKFVVGQRVQYLSMIGEWKQATVIAETTDGYNLKLDCQSESEIFPIHRDDNRFFPLTPSFGVVPVV